MSVWRWYKFINTTRIKHLVTYCFLLMPKKTICCSRVGIVLHICNIKGTISLYIDMLQNVSWQVWSSGLSSVAPLVVTHRLLRTWPHVTTWWQALYTKMWKRVRIKKNCTSVKLYGILCMFLFANSFWAQWKQLIIRMTLLI